MRAIPIARTARRKHGLEPIVGRAGTLDAADANAARRIAARLTAARDEAGEPAVSAGEVAALAALDAALHRLVEDEQTSGRADLAATFDAVDSALGSQAVADVDREWRGHFPAGTGTAQPGANLVAEVLVLAALNENPGASAVRELVDDTPLRDRTAYAELVDEAERQLGGRAADGSAPGDATRGTSATRGRGGVGAAQAGERSRAAQRAGSSVGALGAGAPLPARLREPMVRAPGSLAAQLRWIREHWPAIAADDGLLRRIDLALDVLAEESRALELKTAGDHFGGPLVIETPDYTGLDSDAVAFSSDTEWMPSVVLLAKSTYVWLEQLARRFERPVQTLADVPDEELDRLTSLGVTGLWLIGLWQRSKASAEIKRRRGDQEAVASAYAIDDYRIADDLGGEVAFEDLKRRAWDRGIRMAADMVPNHMGIDSRWVIEHPERFIQVGESPYPAYSFSGPDLADDARVEVQIEDHYWDGTDAAVVFRRRDEATADERFIYHGNDGTSYPWNDTAQLDYLKADVREAVIQTILDVARRAPVIRFDAAMVLARRHIRRLWYPEPGAGGAIPSRAEHAMSNAEFNRRMPKEFWREVVDRVAAEAPGTLLLAEAFWLLEGYFVRTLGMHRVYNSAFMHMLRDEDNAGYRKVMRDTLEFDPAILARFVNFLTNPDERPAAEQFGTTDKAFAAATLLATLPGLPMLGHGQVEGFRERYGMEFRKARWDEPVDEAHADHFSWAIVPLLRRRAAFSGTDAFHLYDAVRDDGTVDENVYAYSNGRGGDRSLVLVHHHDGETTVRIDRSMAAAAPGGSGGAALTSVRLAEALELTEQDDDTVRFVDRRSGFEIRRAAGALRREGLRVTLGAYEARVLSLDPEPAGPPPPATAEPAAEPTSIPTRPKLATTGLRQARIRKRAIRAPSRKPVRRRVVRR